MLDNAVDPSCIAVVTTAWAATRLAAWHQDAPRYNILKPDLLALKQRNTQGSVGAFYPLSVPVDGRVGIDTVTLAVMLHVLVCRSPASVMECSRLGEDVRCLAFQIDVCFQEVSKNRNDYSSL